MSKQTTPGFIHQFEPGSSNRTLLLLHGPAAMRKTFSRSAARSIQRLHFLARAARSSKMECRVSFADSLRVSLMRKT